MTRARPAHGGALLHPCLSRCAAAGLVGGPTAHSPHGLPAQVATILLFGAGAARLDKKKMPDHK